MISGCFHIVLVSIRMKPSQYGKSALEKADGFACSFSGYGKEFARHGIAGFDVTECLWFSQFVDEYLKHIFVSEQMTRMMRELTDECQNGDELPDLTAGEELYHRR